MLGELSVQSAVRSQQQLRPLVTLCSESTKATESGGMIRRKLLHKQ